MKKRDDREKLEEKMTGRQEIYDGVVLHVVKDNVILPNGREAVREVALHNGAVCILPLTDDGKVVMERQYRYAVDEVLWELPAGKIDKGENDPLAAAKRELEEETGYTASEMRSLGVYYSSPAILSEKIYLYLATGLIPGKYHRDEDEFLDVVEVPLGEVAEMILCGVIPDGKTQTAILKYMLKAE